MNIAARTFTKQLNAITVDLNNLAKSHNSFDCLILLNSKKGTTNKQLEQKIMNSCANIVLADGGSNFLYSSPYRDIPFVRSIVGDLDSIRPEVQSYYRSRGVEVEKVYDQDRGDFQKALVKAKQLGCKTILAYGAIGNRMDHTLQAMHMLWRTKLEHPDTEVMIIGDENIIYLLEPSVKYTIMRSPEMHRKGCGLVTFGKADLVLTKGFRWNLGPDHACSSLDWSTFISTSNQFAEDQVEVVTSHPLYFLCRIKNQQSKL